MRTNGFEKPFSKDQAMSWVIQLILIGSFITFVAALLSWEKCLAILLPNAVLVIVVLTAWCICESRDPSQPKPSSSCAPSILRVPAKESRYCGVCHKNSPGLDHHCTWLNTCIAENNYEAFYCLVVFATCQTLLQTVIGILMCTLWKSEVEANATDGWGDAVIALLWIHNAACISLSNSFVLLAGFHTYLLCAGMGTYDFILTNGSEGLCSRMLKCNCLRRKKKTNNKRSHVQHGDTNGTKNAKGVASCSTRGSPPASIMPASLSTPSPIRSQTSLGLAAVAAVLELNANSDSTSRGVVSPNPTELVGAAAMPLSTGVNESEGIFEDVDLSSPMRSLGAVVALVATDP